MSKEVMVLVRCDRCNRPADENLSVSQDNSISFNKASAEVDLCSECQEEARTQVMAWIALGRKPPKVKVPTHNGRQPKQMPTEWKAENETPCEIGDCTYKAKNPFGLSVHQSRVHGIRGEKRRASKTTRPARKTTRKTTRKRTTARRVPAKA